MTFVAGLLLKLSLLGIAVGGVLIGHKYLRMRHDNIIEEVVEQTLKDQTGMDIDLSPSDSEPIHSDEVKNVGEFISSVISDIEKL